MNVQYENIMVLSALMIGSLTGALIGVGGYYTIGTLFLLI